MEPRRPTDPEPNQSPMITTCPDDDQLKKMVAGTLPETAEQKIVVHLDECQGCQDRIEKIAAGNSSIIEVARSAVLDTPPEVRSAFWPALKKVELELDTPLPEGVSRRPAVDVSATVTSMGYRKNCRIGISRTGVRGGRAAWCRAPRPTPPCCVWPRPGGWTAAARCRCSRMARCPRRCPSCTTRPCLWP